MDENQAQLLSESMEIIIDKIDKEEFTDAL